jgi:cysteine-rich repeat protein
MNVVLHWASFGVEVCHGRRYRVPREPWHKFPMWKGRERTHFFLCCAAVSWLAASACDERPSGVGRSALSTDPDLVAAIDAPRAVASGGQLSLRVRVCNNGVDAAASSVVRAFLSEDQTIDGADAVLFARDAPALASGACWSGESATTVTIASSAERWILAEADATAVVSEAEETNNGSAQPIGIWTGEASAVFVRSVRAPKVASDSFEVEAIVCNDGNSQASGQVVLYASSDAVHDAADVVLDGLPFYTGLPGCEFAGATVNPPSGLSGTYRLLAVYELWGQDGVPEIVPSDDVFVAGEIGFGEGSHLALRRATFHRGFSYWAQHRIVWELCNEGNAPSPEGYVDFFASADETFDDEWSSEPDEGLGYVSVPAIAPGRCIGDSLNTWRPTNATFRLFARIFDTSGQLGGGEAIFRGDRYRGGETPDLTVRSVRSPSLVQGSASITSVVCNEGSAASVASPLRVYAAREQRTARDLGDLHTLIGATAIPPLEPGRCSIDEVEAIAPPPGREHFLAAIVDEDRHGIDSDRENDLFVGNGLASGSGPDLAVVTVEIPPAGETSFTFSSRICNVGDLAAESAVLNLRAAKKLDYLLPPAEWWARFDGQAFVPPLAAGACADVSGEVWLSSPGGGPISGSDLGTYFVRVHLDPAPGDLVRSNDARLAGKTIALGSIPELLVRANVPANAPGVVDAEWEVCNVGAATGVGDLTFFVADTKERAALGSGYPIETVYQIALAPGECRAGTSYISLFYAPQHMLAEIAFFVGDSLERRSDYAVTSDHYDLELANISATLSLDTETIGVELSLCQAGYPDSTVGLYVTAAEALPAGLAPLEPSRDGSLTFFEQDEGCHTFSATLAAPQAAGTFVVYAVAGDDGWIRDEQNPLNNVRFSAPLVTLSSEPPVCGDGLRVRGEACDDGNSSSGDGCTSACVLERCGDGALNNGGAEQCDDGNSSSGDGCSAACLLERCGDGAVNNNGTESCDDGNLVPGDGCTASCVVERCGDGAVNNAGREQCDDGNTTAGDGCSSICAIEYCGDGTVNDAFARRGSSHGSPPETPGNGSGPYGEECDDGNAISGDGCNAICEIEFCGDGVVNDGGSEICDDGNTTDADGCGATCLTEVPEEPWHTNENGLFTTSEGLNYAFGYHFTALSAGHITALGARVNGTKTVRLFDKTSGAILAEAVVTAAGDWAYSPIVALPVTAGAEYTVAVYLAGSGGTHRSNIAPLPATYGAIRIEASTEAMTLIDPAARPTSSLHYVMNGQADIRFVPLAR